MTDLESRLELALKAAAVAARDPAFRVAVLERREQAAFRRQLLTAGATAVGAGGLAAVVGGLAHAGALAAAGVALAALLGTLYAAARPALQSSIRDIRLGAPSALRTMPARRLWF